MSLRRRRCIRLVALVLMFFIGCSISLSANAAKKSGWVSKSGKAYYYQDNGKKAKGLVEIKNKTYYFDGKGVRKSGWQKIKKKYYFFSLSTGVMQKNRSGKKAINGIRLKKDGTAKVTKQNKLKIQMLVQAEKIKDEITKPTMSKAEKLKVCFDWVISFRYRTLRKIDFNSDWVPVHAADILDGNGGNCYSDAAAFAFLANACGYKKVYACSSTGHGWAEIGGKIYDPLVAEDRPGQNYYGRPYASSPGFIPAIRVKI